MIFIKISVGILLGFTGGLLVNKLIKRGREVWEGDWPFHFLFPVFNIDIKELQWQSATTDQDKLLCHVGCSSMPMPVIEGWMFHRCSACEQRVRKQEMFAMKMMK